MTTDDKKLHLGCGYVTPEGWINVDGSWNAWLAQHPVLRRAVAALGLVPKRQLDMPWSSHVVCLDLRRPLPYVDNSFFAIYTSHLLEHMYRVEARRLLEQCLRVLRPGGVIRVVVPDLRTIVNDYLAGKTSDSMEGNKTAETPADLVNVRLMLRTESPPRGPLPYRLYTVLKDFHTHKWMYDADSLAGLMFSVGFVEVRPREYLDSAIPDISEVERAERVLEGRGVCVEGVKR